VGRRLTASPSKVQGCGAMSRASSPTALSSHGVGRSSECCLRRCCRRIGLPAPSMTSLFPGSLSGLHLAAVPRPLASPGSSSRELHLSYRVFPAPNLPRTEVRGAFLGVLFLIAASAQRVHLRASIPSSLYGPPSAFLTLSTVCSSPHLASLFHPATTSRIHLSGVCSRCLAGTTSSVARTLLSLPASAYRRVASTTPARAASPSGSCSVQRFEATGRVISPPDTSIPS